MANRGQEMSYQFGYDFGFLHIVGYALLCGVAIGILASIL